MAKSGTPLEPVDLSSDDPTVEVSSGQESYFVLSWVQFPELR